MFKFAGVILTTSPQWRHYFFRVSLSEMLKPSIQVVQVDNQLISLTITMWTDIVTGQTLSVCVQYNITDK